MPASSSALKHKICFISSRSGFVADSNTLYMDWANGRLIQQLAQQFDSQFSIAIFSDSRHRKNHDFEIKVQRVYTLPFPFSYAGGLRNFFHIRSALRKIAQENDLLIIQLPFAGFLSLLSIRKPTVYHLCANVLTAASNPFKYQGLKLVASKSFAWCMHQVFRRLLQRKDTLLITNGNELAQVYMDCHPRVTVSSSIFQNEIITQADVVRKQADVPFRLLFIGRPSREKGFHTLMEAYEELVRKQNPVELSLLGVQKQELLQLMEGRISSDLLARITFYDFVPWGDRFKEIVKSSHALTLCSVSEGTPRVLIEARALGCPVIATRVGGIPSSVIHDVDGILFGPEDATALVAAVEKLQNENFRQELIVNGLHTVKNHTLEKFAEVFAMALNELQRDNES